MDHKILGKGLVVSLLTLAMLGFFFLGGHFTSPVSAELESRNEIAVNGAGVIKAKPDTGIVNVAVDTTNADPKTAQAENTKLSNQLVDALKKAGIKEDDIKTGHYNMYREYDYYEGKSTEGNYRVTHSYEITVRDINKVGSIIDVATENGANQVNNVRFTVADSSKYYQEALKAAIKNAEEKANTIASTISVKIGKPSKVIEAGYYEPTPVYMDTAFVKGEAQNGSTQIISGELEIRANVQVTYNY